MSNYYYQYTGTISVSSDGGRDLILDDIYDETKPPIAVKVPCSALAEYLSGRGNTDEEERYIPQTWIYDWNLFLQAVIIPSKEKWPPAKVIACADPDRMSDEIVIFGPAELIDTDKPEKMSTEDAAAWLNFQCEFRLRPLN